MGKILSFLNFCSGKGGAKRDREKEGGGGGRGGTEGWEKEGGRRPLLFGDGVKIGGRGGAEMHRAQGASGLDQLHQFGVAGEKPLGTEGTRESRFEGKRGAGGIEVEDGGT